MSSSRFDAIVIGAGVMGSAAAYRLARGGRSVALLERFGLGHRRGSSHGASRIFRLSYPDEDYVAMALESRELWRELERATGVDLLTTTGGFDGGDAVAPISKALSRSGVFHEVMTGAEATRRFPQVRFPANAEVLHQPDSGVVAAESAVKTFQRGAEAGGAVIHTQTPALEISENGDGVRVATPRGPLEADVLIVTAGAWVGSLLAPLGIELPVRPTRETVAYFRIERRPPTLVEWGQPTIYSLPSPDDSLKAGEHIAGPTTDPNTEGAPNEDSLQRVREWVAARWPGAEPKEYHAETCLYTNTPDEHFILERRGGIVIGSPCSGHGFKFAPLIGKRLAALAEEVL